MLANAKPTFGNSLGLNSCTREKFLHEKKQKLKSRHRVPLSCRGVESLQSHCIHTMSHWSSWLPIYFLSWGTRVQSAGEYLCETRILLLGMSCYIGEPDVIDHCGLVWGRLHPEPSLGRRADNVIIPLDLTQLFCPGFTLAAGPPSSFTTDIVGCWGGEPCGEPAISLQLPHVSLVQWTTRLLPVMRDRGSIPRGVQTWNRDSPVSVVSLQWHFYTVNQSRLLTPFYFLSASCVVEFSGDAMFVYSKSVVCTLLLYTKN
jgi:hypothetical protein